MDDIKEKINKLLAMAAHERSNEHESETAMRMAEMLMKKHCVALADLEASSGKRTIYTWGSIDCEVGPIRGKPASWCPMWIGYLSLGVAKFCDVKAAWWQNGEKGHCMKFVGDVDDLEFAQWLFDKLRDFGYIEANVMPGKHRETFKKSYAIRLQQRLNELRKQRDADLAAATTQTGNALITVENKLTLRDAQFGQQRVSHRASKMGSEGFSEGRAAADRANLNRPLGSNAGRPRLQ